MSWQAGELALCGSHRRPWRPLDRIAEHHVHVVVLIAASIIAPTLATADQNPVTGSRPCRAGGLPKPPCSPRIFGQVSGRGER